MLHSNLPFECKGLKYLNSTKIVVAGNSSHGHLEILQTEGAGMQSADSSGYFKNLNEIEFPNSILTDIEICGVTSQARTLVATANVDFKSKIGYICLVDANLSRDSCPLKVAATLNEDESESVFTSLSFNLHQTHLAASSDVGDVLLFDILTEKKISGFRADACGVNKVQFTRTGQLVTAGSSADSQLRLWDGRVDMARGGLTNSGAVRAFAHPTSSSSSFRKPFASYTSLALHPSLPVVYCGSDSGEVIEWDLRYEAGKKEHSLASRRVSPHESRVTALVYHPVKDDVLLTASVDGTVKESNIVASLRHEKTIISEVYPASVSCMDLHADEGLLVAASSIGSIWQIVV